MKGKNKGRTIIPDCLTKATEILSSSSYISGMLHALT
jgi:hypothetical protein